jgi:hypothetical protein
MQWRALQDEKSFKAKPESSSDVQPSLLLFTLRHGSLYHISDGPWIFGNKLLTIHEALGDVHFS